MDYLDLKDAHDLYNRMNDAYVEAVQGESEAYRALRLAEKKLYTDYYKKVLEGEIPANRFDAVLKQGTFTAKINHHVAENEVKKARSTMDKAWENLQIVKRLSDKQ